MLIEFNIISVPRDNQFHLFLDVSITNNLPADFLESIELQKNQIHVK